MYQLEKIATGEVIIVSEQPRFVLGIWECGNQRFTDREGLEYREKVDTAGILAIEAAVFIRKVDTDTDAVIKAAVGERLNEYNLAEKEALEYQAAGYTGTVPTSVSSWATAKGWTATQAADDILASAANLLAAQQAIRANRLLAKESARNAVDIAALDTVKSDWSSFLAAIKAQLNI